MIAALTGSSRLAKFHHKACNTMIVKDPYTVIAQKPESYTNRRNS